MISVFSDLASERAAALRNARSCWAGSEARGLAWLELSRVHLAAGRLAQCALWLRRAASHRLGSAGEFAAACLGAVLDFEQHMGTVFGMCIPLSELTKAARASARTSPWAASWQSQGPPPGLSAPEHRWCLQVWAMVCARRMQDRQTQIRAGWAVAAPEAAQRFAASLLARSMGELEQLGAVPVHALPAAFECARVAWVARNDEAAELALKLALGFAPAHLHEAAGACAELARVDAIKAPLSSGALWNLAIRVSERECNELGKSIERSEFTPPPGDQVDRGLPDGREGTLPWRVMVHVALRRAHASSLEGLAAEAAEHADAAVRLAAGAGDLRLHAWALTMSCAAALADGRLALAWRRATQLQAVLQRSGSSGAWALGCCLTLSRWGRQAQLRHRPYPMAAAAFSLAQRLAVAFGLKVAAAQSLVDLAAADEAIGFRQLSCARYRAATEVFLRECLASPGFDATAFRRCIFVLNRTIIAYAYEGDERGTGLICADLEALIERFAPSAMPDAASTAELQSLIEYARDRLGFMRLVDRLTAALEARRAGHVAGVEAAWASAQHLLASQAEGDRAFWTMQFARERNDLDAAAHAADAWLAHGLAGGPLHDIEQAFAEAEGDLARDELIVHHVEMHVSAMKALAAVRRYADAMQQLRWLERVGGLRWFDKWAAHRYSGRLDTARVLLGCGQHGEAAALCSELIDMHEALEAQISDDTRLMSLAAEPGLADAYVLASAAELARDDERTAFSLAERGRARALKRLRAGPASSLVRSAAALASNAYRSYEQSSASAAFGGSEQGVALSDAVLDGSAVFRDAREARGADVGSRQHAHARQHVDPGKEAELEAVMAHCPPSTAVLAWSITDDVCLSWSCTANSLHAWRLPVEPRQLAAVAARFVRACGRGGETEALGAELGHLLLAPHAVALRDTAQVVVVPHGDLFRLPLHALSWRPGEGPLCATHAVGTLPAAALLGPVPPRGASTRRPDLVIGRPDKPGDAIDRELEAVGALLGCGATRSDQLSRTRLLRLIREAGRIHIAAHATAQHRQPWDSGLELLGAGAAPVTAADIGALGPVAELVTLGGCSTGAAGRARSDLTGFSRALLASGVGTCVVSLWDVHSAATEALMRAFYRALIDGKAPAAALCQAQDALRRGAVAPTGEADGRRVIRPREAAGAARDPGTWKSPHFWAGFVATGPGAFSRAAQ